MKLSMALRLALVLAALGSAGLVAAQGPGPGGSFGNHKPPMERALGPRGDHGRWWNDQTMIDKLKLTDEQRKAMDGILMDHRTKLVDLRANLDKAELVMEPLMSSEQPNEAAILAQIDKVAMARAELEKANARFLLAIRGKLTPEQWKILQTDRRTHMDKGGPGGRLGGHGEGRPMPPPPGGPMGKVDDDGPDDAGQPANGLPQ